MRVLQITPTFFGDGSVVGGAERYVMELARAMAHDADVTLLTFGDVSREFEQDGVRTIQMASRDLVGHPLSRNPVSLRLFSEIRRADIVHSHQVQTFASAAAVITGRLLRRP